MNFFYSKFVDEENNNVVSQIGTPCSTFNIIFFTDEFHIQYSLTKIQYFQNHCYIFILFKNI